MEGKKDERELIRSILRTEIESGKDPDEMLFQAVTSYHGYKSIWEENCALNQKQVPNFHVL